MSELDQAWSESILDDFLKEETDTIVRRALADNGYLKPDITVSVTTADVKTLHIDIVPGDRALDRRISVSAGDAVLASDLEDWIRDQGLDEIAWEEPSTVVDALEARLGSLGYLNAKATAELPRVEGRTATRVFTVDEGAAFTLGDVQFKGAESLDVARLRESTALDAGSPYDPAAVEEARTRVTRLLRDDGYADAAVSLTPAADETTHTVSMAFTIVPGPRQILRDVTVEGNRSIDTDVITRALDVTVGEPIGVNSWLPARARLFDTALFQRADVKLEPLSDTPASPGERPMRMVVTVQEWPALRVRYGIGISEEHSQTEINGRDLVPGLSADITRRTLFGRAITIGGAAEYQRLQRLGRVFLTTPTLFGLPVESVMTLERRREDLAGETLLSSRSSVTWEQRVRVTNPLRLSYSFKFERNHVFEKNPIPDPLFPPFDTTVNTGRLAIGALFDTRDNPIDTRRGVLLSSNVEWAPESLGSGISFLRHLGQAYYFRPWKGMVAASAVRVGTIVPLGGEGLISSELFYSGGARSVRGVEQDGLGPRNAFDEPAGGGGMIVLNQELRFPIFRWTSGVGFVDAGNVFTTPSAIDFGNLVASYGLGLRVTTPFAMLRVDYARLRSPSPGQTGGRWTFGIGQAF
jgi:outer membrane protein assembly factor BamA